MSDTEPQLAVVGGSYWETIEDPGVKRFMGSGLRAAAFLGDSCSTFHTCCSSEEHELIAATAPNPNFRAVDRPDSIDFRYQTPVSSPRLHSGNCPEHSETVEAKNVLVYGMVEQTHSVTAERVVVDPQHSLGLGDISSLVSAKQLAVVCNRREALSLAKTSDITAAGETIRDELSATVVVIKCGAVGALLLQSNEWTGIPAHPTDHVHPLGSGDVFSAAFARSWTSGTSAHEAALEASLATAGYCGTGQLGYVQELPVSQFQLDPPTPGSVNEPPTVYLASSYATLPQRWLMRQAHQALSDVGVRVFNPLVDVGPADDIAATARADSSAIPNCRSMLLLMDDAGSGVSWEAGAAQSQGIPVVAFKSQAGPRDLTMIRGHSGIVVSDLSTAVYHAAWQACANSPQ